MWNEERDLYLSGNFNIQILSILQCLELTKFSGSLFFSGEKLNRRSRSEGVFRESELSLSLSLLVPSERFCCLFLLEFKKGKIFCNKKAVPELSEPQRYLQSVIIVINCYLAAPRPILAHFERDGLTNPMLITAYFRYFDPRVTRIILVTRLGS